MESQEEEMSVKIRCLLEINGEFTCECNSEWDFTNDFTCVSFIYYIKIH